MLITFSGRTRLITQNNIRILMSTDHHERVAQHPLVWLFDPKHNVSEDFAFLRTLRFYGRCHCLSLLLFLFLVLLLFPFVKLSLLCLCAKCVSPLL